MKRLQASRKLGGATDAIEATPATAATARCAGLRVSCFHSATQFSTIVTSAEPWITCTSRPGLKSASIAPNTMALTMVPSSSMTYISPTTRGWDSTGARSVASARPAVCVVCSPAPTIRKAMPAPAWPIQAGHCAALPPPESTSSAKGMMASPPNWISVPIQM